MSLNLGATIFLVLVAWCSVSLPCALLICRWLSEKKPQRPMGWRAWHRSFLPR